MSKIRLLKVAKLILLLMVLLRVDTSIATAGTITDSALDHVRVSGSNAENTLDFRNNHVFFQFYGQNFPLSMHYQRYLGSVLGGNGSVKIGGGGFRGNHQTISAAAMIEYPLFWRYFAGYGIGYNYRTDRTEMENYDAGVSLHLNRRAYGEEIITYGVSLNFGAILLDQQGGEMKNDFPFLIDDRFIISMGFHFGIGF